MAIPGNIPKQNNYSDLFPDFTETYNLDLYSNIGSIRTTHTKKVTDSTDDADLDIVIAFKYFDGKYFAATDDFVFEGGADPSDPFTKITGSGDQPGSAGNGDISVPFSDMEIFNGKLYVSATDSVFSRTTAGTWAEPITSNLTSSSHLLTAYGEGALGRLYITEGGYKVYSINTSDTLATSGSFTLDLGLSSDWIITVLESAETEIWIGVSNISTGKGVIYTWDGQTEDTPSRRIELNASPIAGTVLDNVLYIVDSRGRLLRYAGNSFIELDKFKYDGRYLYDNADSNTNERFITPNGITATDYGTILIAFHNQLESAGAANYNDQAPSGVYEWHPDMGLHLKHSISLSEAGSTTTTDYGALRVNQMGAIHFQRSANATQTDNGSLLVSAHYFTDQTSTAFGIFTDDSLDTTQDMGYFITHKIPAQGITDTWSKAYATYKDLINAADKIVVKYRTVEKTDMFANCAWLNSKTFTSTDDLSNVEVGDEVTVVQGAGAGMAVHVTEITSSSNTYTVTVDNNSFSATGTFIGRFRNFKKTIAVTKDQYSEITLPKNNTGIWCQYKVELYFTGKQEFYKLHPISKPNVIPT